VDPFTPTIGSRVRLILHHEKVGRPLVCLSVGRDGSVYLGTLLNRPSHGAIGLEARDAALPRWRRPPAFEPVADFDIRIPPARERK
jgi:hypothetical protein